MPLTAGTRLGPYEIQSHLGAGGMGDVYKARDARLDRFVAIKILRAQLTGDPDSRRRFEREARAISALNHPHICTLYDVGRQDDLDFLVMELVSGETLASRVARQGPLPIEDATRYGMEVADALAHAHDRGIIHRDLKSANVVVTPAGGTKVLDFGLAVRLRVAEDIDSRAMTRSRAALTHTATMAGTLDYMAPEVLQGASADSRTDLWALGVLLYEMVTGVRPFRGETPFEVTSAILRDPPAPPPSGVPGSLRAIIQRCLVKDPAQRYRRADEVRVALDTSRRTAPPAPGSLGLQRVRPGTLVDAEQRQVSVLCGELAGAAALAEQLEPAEVREVLCRYQDCCAEAIRRFNGLVAQSAGYGCLAYFGYPQAHEDDAQRAVRAGLEMVRAVAAVNRARAAPPALALSVRVGIDTGRVVAEEMAATEPQAATATIVGDAPGIAARLQALAEPNSVVVSEHTLRLLQGAFDVEDLGLQSVKGLSDLSGACRVLSERRAEDRFDATHATRLTPLVGREEELALLLSRWALAKEGEGQVIALRGEPGIGKSRILRALRERLASEQPVRVSFQCSPFFTNTAFYPVIEQLQRALGLTEDDSSAARLEKLDAWLASAGGAGADAPALLAALLSLDVEGRVPPLHLSPQRQKERTIEVLVEQLRRRAEGAPLVVVFEDLHWIDPNTAELLDHLVARVADSRILLLVTYRPEFAPPWAGYTHVTVHSLTRLSKRHCALMATKVADKALPDPLVHHIVEKTDGVPLFVEELTKAVIESTLVTDAGDRYELAGDVDMVGVPATLHDSLMARLDRLIPMKEVAQIGAAIGREFSYALLSAVSPMREDELQAALERIVGSALVFQRGQPPHAVYTFKHALVQDAAYDSLLKRRKVELHQRIARVLEAKFPETAETQPELVAQHYTRAECIEAAIPYWLKAGRRALAKSAPVEAASHLEQGLALVLTREATPERDRTELEFQAALGAAHMSAYGWGAASTGRAYDRATALCQRVGLTRDHVPILFGDVVYTGVTGDIHGAVKKAREIRELSLTTSDDAIHLLAAFGQLWSYFYNGRFRDTIDGVKEVLRLYVPEQHLRFASETNHDFLVIARQFEAFSLWMLGYPDQAIACRIETEAVERRQASEHGLFYQLSFGLSWIASTFAFCRDFVALQQRSDEGVRMATDLGFAPTGGLATINQGHCLFELGRREEGFERFVKGFTDYYGLTAGLGVGRPYFLILYAWMLGRLGRVEEGLERLDQAEQQVAEFGEEWPLAEVLRVKGELLATMAGEESRAEASYRRAIEVAQRQHARSWELRAATSLARLLQRHGREPEARDVLAPVYAWFTEGFARPDLLEAKELLDALT